MEEVQKLYQISEIRELEKLASQTYGISEAAMMAQAGQAAFDDIRNHFSYAKNLVVICGKGNNGGDGYVLANLAHAQNLQVKVRFVGGLPKPETPAYHAYETCYKNKLDIQEFRADEIWDANLIVDAIFGIGVERPLEGIYLTAVQKINASGIEILAIDIPSGLNADTGTINGMAVRAALTTTFIGYKRGLFTAEAPEYCGKVFCHNLGLPSEAFAKITASSYLIPYAESKNKLPPRPRNANKGLFGHVLVIGGYFGMAGAVRMAAEASLRIGAGLVSVATIPEHVGIVTTMRPEIMCLGVRSGAELESLIDKANVIVIGPGLGKSAWSLEMLDVVLQTDKKKILDADALNLLAENPTQRDNWILSPHSGEASRLLSCSIEEIQRDRFAAVACLQEKYHGVCILKGAGTLIKATCENIGVCRYGNPGMATGGMGDVLSGVLGGLVAQKLSLEEAAEVGVLIHAVAGDQVAAMYGERGMLACDLMQEIRLLANGIA